MSKQHASVSPCPLLVPFQPVGAHAVSLIPKAGIVLVALLLTSACFSSETIITVKANGSGSIEQTNLLNTQLIGMAGAMMSKGMGNDAGGTTAKLPSVEEIFSDEEMAKRASQLGSGVRFVSNERVTNGDLHGSKALYAFDDIRTVSMGPRTRAARSDAAPNMTASPELSFGLTQRAGGVSVLTITLPDRAGEARPNDMPQVPARIPDMSEVPPEGLAMMKSMFHGSRVAVNVDVEGQVVKTNSPYVQGSRVTLMELDLAELVGDPAGVRALEVLKPGVDFATIKKTLEGVKSVKVVPEPVVTIEFR
jgi:hypothetical protein